MVEFILVASFTVGLKMTYLKNLKSLSKNWHSLKNDISITTLVKSWSQLIKKPV